MQALFCAFKKLAAPFLNRFAGRTSDTSDTLAFRGRVCQPCHGSIFMKLHRRLFASVCLSILLGLGFATRLPGQAQGEPKILFLHLRMKDGAVTFVKSNTVPGTLKPPRQLEKQGAIQIQIETREGISLWQNAMDDPELRRYEYADPDHPGAIKAKFVRLNAVEFVVRVPVFKGAHHLSLYRKIAPGIHGPAVPAVKAAEAAKTLLATFELPAEDKQ